MLTAYLWRSLAVIVLFLALLLMTGPFQQQFPLVAALFGPLVNSIAGQQADSLSAAWLTWGDPPVSRVDGACKGLWVERARNDMALRCYASTDVSRLCSPQERQHFAWLVARYVQDERAFNQELTALVPVVALSQAAAGQGEGVVPPQLTSLKESGFAKAFRLPVLRDSEVTALIRSLATRGYLHRGDLGWHVPARFEAAFSTVDPPGLPADCPAL